jgi:protoheme IX farnesyltransferase
LILYFNNFLTWALTFGTWIFYAFFYTKVLKFSGSQNIVIGGLAGAMPPLLGWTAVVGSIDPLPLLLVLLIFIWTPPHFWALAINKKDEYAKAGIPMMPVVKGIEYTKIQIVLYSILLMVVSLLLFATGYFGYLYLVGAAILGGIFIQKSWKLKKSMGADNSMSLFLYSIVYLTLIFLLMLVDRAATTYV